MISRILEIGVMIEKIREKKRHVLMLIFSTVSQKSRDQIRYGHQKAQQC